MSTQLTEAFVHNNINSVNINTSDELLDKNNYDNNCPSDLESDQPYVNAKLDLLNQEILSLQSELDIMAKARGPHVEEDLVELAADIRKQLCIIHNKNKEMAVESNFSYIKHILINLQRCFTHLLFSHDFNEPVDDLPNFVTDLTFGYCFNQPVDDLPNFVTDLTFGY